MIAMVIVLYDGAPLDLWVRANGKVLNINRTVAREPEGLVAGVVRSVLFRCLSI